MDRNSLKRLIEIEILTTLAEKTSRKKVPLAVSGRHVHLSREHVEQLFGKDYRLQMLKPLSQPNQYACKEVVTIKTKKGELEKVRVLGPERPDTQVEISMTDAFKIGVTPMIRMSGDVVGTPGVTLVSQTASVNLNQGVIIAKRHLHISNEQAKNYGLRDGQTIKVKYDGQRATIFDEVVVRSGNGHELEVHIDTDEANAALIKNGDYGEVID